ncbi:MAG TPA: ankyrin repeat domain-containing protein, partial [Terriglobales bacterium]|nr:ankyrin repeat domain-containing protein [Terriglobales bacterium]
AVMVGNEDMVRFLVAQGANVNPANNHAATPLHIAAMFGRVQEAEILLEHGASTSVLDEEGRTPLEEALVHPAITCRATGSQPVEVSEVVRILKKYGAQEHGR